MICNNIVYAGPGAILVGKEAKAMKKFGKFLFGTLSLAAAAGGIYCLYKKRINKDADADFDDFDDDVDEDEGDEDFTVSTDPEDREYVSITITSEDGAQSTPSDETKAEDGTEAANDGEAPSDAATDDLEDIDEVPYRTDTISLS